MRDSTRYFPLTDDELLFLDKHNVKVIEVPWLVPPVTLTLTLTLTLTPTLNPNPYVIEVPWLVPPGKTLRAPHPLLVLCGCSDVRRGIAVVHTASARLY